MSLIPFTLLAHLLLSTAHADAPKAPKIEVLGPASAECRSLYEQMLPSLTQGDVRAFAGSLSRLPELLSLAGMPPLHRKATLDALFSVMNDTTDILLSKTNRALLGAFHDENSLALCVLHSQCRLGPTSSAVHISSGHPYQIKPLLGGNRSGLAHAVVLRDQPVAPPWQGLLLKFKPLTPDAKRDLTFTKNLVDFFHEGSHYADTLLLAQWSKAIQGGARVHPKLQNVISPDGKVVDEGFLRVFLESRSEIVEAEATLAYYRQSGVPEHALKEARKQMEAGLAKGAIKAILEYGTIGQVAMDELGIREGNVLRMAQEMEKWMRSSIP